MKQIERMKTDFFIRFHPFRPLNPRSYPSEITLIL